MLNIIEVNEKVYLYLIERRKEEKNLRFTFRKSNLSNRLEEGYWFYGNDKYMAVSFWTGMDWKNRTPNIIFIINQKGGCSLEINVSDSDIKREFVENFIKVKLNLDIAGRRYFKHYSGESADYIYELTRFLDTDKLLIDEIISRHNHEIMNEKLGDNAIKNIDPNEFTNRHNKVKKYRTLKQEIDDEYASYGFEEKPGKILSIRIRDYGFIEDIDFKIHSKWNQWVFLTGENGSGKTNILRAIGTVLGHRQLSKKELEKNPNFYAQVKLMTRDESEFFERELNKQSYGKKRPVVQALAMYGPYRLDITDENLSETNFRKQLNKEGSFHSLMNSGIKLLSLDKQIEFWRKGVKQAQELLAKREYYIKSILTMIVPSLVEIDIQIGNKLRKTEYILRDFEDSETTTLTWDELPSGHKSLISMIGDILIRFYDQQRNVLDPSEFRGVVLIDEIDLHLHPKAQIDIVRSLTNTFPYIQFIVTTHSPIPFIGAPKNSQIYVIKQSDERKIRMDRIDDKVQFYKLLPNAILTSPIFNLDELVNSDIELGEVRTEDNFTEAIFNDMLQKKIEKLKNEDL